MIASEAISSQSCSSSTTETEMHNNGSVELSSLSCPIRETILNKNALKRTEHPTSDFETFLNLLKFSVGLGLLSMPIAVKNAGYIVGTLGVLLLGGTAVHCTGLLLDTATTLRKKYQVVSLDYSETMVFAWLEVRQPKIAKAMRHVVNIFLALTQFGFCTSYIVFIAGMLQQVIFIAYGAHLPEQAWIMIVTLAIIVLSWIRNLDHLAPLSLIGNICLFVGISVVLFDEVDRLATHRAAVYTDTFQPARFDLSLALFIGTVFFTFESIGSTLPLENKMRNPGHAKVLVYVVLAPVVTLFALFGLLGYLAYGSNLHSSVILNLCSAHVPTQIIFLVTKLLFGLNILASYLVQFYVPIDFMEPQVMKILSIKCPKISQRTVVSITLRSMMVLVTATVALTVPDLNDIMSLVGAVASSMLAFVFPPLMEILVMWRNRAKQHWLSRLLCFIKDVLIILLGLVGFGFGTFGSVYNIVFHYSHLNISTAVQCARVY